MTSVPGMIFFRGIRIGSQALGVAFGFAGVMNNRTNTRASFLERPFQTPTSSDGESSHVIVDSIEKSSSPGDHCENAAVNDSVDEGKELHFDELDHLTQSPEIFLDESDDFINIVAARMPSEVQPYLTVLNTSSPEDVENIFQELRHPDQMEAMLAESTSLHNLSRAGARHALNLAERLACRRAEAGGYLTEDAHHENARPEYLDHQEPTFIDPPHVTADELHRKWEILRRELTCCSLCLDVLAAPNLVDCSHSFCGKCLEDYLESATPQPVENSYFLSQPPCPCCRAPIQACYYQRSLDDIIVMRVERERCFKEAAYPPYLEWAERRRDHLARRGEGALDPDFFSCVGFDSPTSPTSSEDFNIDEWADILKVVACIVTAAAVILSTQYKFETAYFLKYLLGATSKTKGSNT